MRLKSERSHEVKGYISPYCEANHHPTTYNVTVRYLMPLKHILPFLAGLAFIVMVCLEIAWHT
jgi:uncharacterized protein YggT (Ycf19 family)